MSSPLNPARWVASDAPESASSAVSDSTEAFATLGSGVGVTLSVGVGESVGGAAIGVIVAWPTTAIGIVQGRIGYCNNGFRAELAHSAERALH